MKTKILIFLVISIFVSSKIFSHYGWITQQTNTGNHIISVFFPTTNVGYATGWYGTILKTTNGGNNWISQNYSYPWGFEAVYFSSENTGWITGEGGTIIHTTNGGQTWYPQNSGTNVIFIFIRFINSLTGWAAGYNGTIVKTTDGGNTWISQYTGVSSNLTCVFFINANSGWASGDNGTILKTTNGGTNWQSVSTGVQNNLGKMYFVNASTGWIPGTNGLILKTTNGGSSWLMLASGTSKYLICSNFPNASTGYISGAGIILKTKNGGLNWVRQNCGTTNELHWIFFINSLTGWSSGYYGTVVKTTTGGSHCPCPHSPENGITNVPLNATLNWEEYPEITNYTVQLSTNQNFSNLIDAANIDTNSYTVPIGKLQSFTTYFWRVRGNGQAGPTDWSDIWNFITSNSIGINYISSIVPADFKLYSNYPNPFNPATKIKFDLPKKTFTSLIVYDALGRSVETLVNTELKEGSYEYTWSADKYNSGVYFIRIVSDKFVETRKMVLLK
jgi:photosystem II stability/assembly factor-like uncharacterized protein